MSRNKEIEKIIERASNRADEELMLEKMRREAGIDEEKIERQKKATEELERENYYEENEELIASVVRVESLFFSVNDREVINKYLFKILLNQAVEINKEISEIIEFLAMNGEEVQKIFVNYLKKGLSPLWMYDVVVNSTKINKRYGNSEKNIVKALLLSGKSHVDVWREMYFEEMISTVQSTWLKEIMLECKKAGVSSEGTVEILNGMSEDVIKILDGLLEKDKWILREGEWENLVEMKKNNFKNTESLPFRVWDKFLIGVKNRQYADSVLVVLQIKNKLRIAQKVDKNKKLIKYYDYYRKDKGLSSEVAFALTKALDKINPLPINEFSIAEGLRSGVKMSPIDALEEIKIMKIFDMMRSQELKVLLKSYKSKGTSNRGIMASLDQWANIIIKRMDDDESKEKIQVRIESGHRPVLALDEYFAEKRKMYRSGNSS